MIPSNCGLQLLKIKQRISINGASLSFLVDHRVCNKDGKTILCDIDIPQGNYVLILGHAGVFGIKSFHGFCDCLIAILCAIVISYRQIHNPSVCGFDSIFSMSLVSVIKVAFFVRASTFSFPVLSQWRAKPLFRSCSLSTGTTFNTSELQLFLEVLSYLSLAARGDNSMSHTVSRKVIVKIGARLELSNIPIKL